MKRSRGWEVLTWGAVLAGMALYPWLVTSPFYQHLLVLTGINLILVIALDLVVGKTGLLALSHAAVSGIGAYGAAILTARLGVSFWLALPAAGFASGVVGLAVGYVTRRLRGAYFAVATFVFGITLHLLFTNLTEVTGGPMGMSGLLPPTLALPGGIQIGFWSQGTYAYLVFAVLLLEALAYRWIERSRMGRALVAIREEQDLAESVGVEVARYKALAMGLSAGFAGLGGALFAHYMTYIGPDFFTFLDSFQLLVMDLLGGPGTLLGPAVGALVLTVIEEATRSLSPAVAQIAYGVFLVATIGLMPAGIVGELARRGREKHQAARTDAVSLPGAAETRYDLEGDGSPR